MFSYPKDLEQLDLLYEDYVSTISVEACTVSLEIVKEILARVYEQKAKRILNVGGNFITAALRLFGFDCLSIEDSFYWLEQSKEFLAKHNLDTSITALLDDEEEDLEGVIDGYYDYMICDYGEAMGYRWRILYSLLNHLSESGELWLNDLENTSYLKTLIEVFRQYMIDKNPRGLIKGEKLLIRVRKDLEDSYGRYGGYVNRGIGKVIERKDTLVAKGVWLLVIEKK